MSYVTRACIATRVRQPSSRVLNVELNAKLCEFYSSMVIYDQAPSSAEIAQQTSCRSLTIIDVNLAAYCFNIVVTNNLLGLCKQSTAKVEDRHRKITDLESFHNNQPCLSDQIKRLFSMFNE